MNSATVTATSKNFPSVLRTKLTSNVQAVRPEDRESRLRIARICPACDAKEMTWSEAQLRSADEGTTIFYRCPDCGHRWAKCLFFETTCWSDGRSESKRGTSRWTKARNINELVEIIGKKMLKKMLKKIPFSSLAQLHLEIIRISTSNSIFLLDSAPIIRPWASSTYTVYIAVTALLGWFGIGVCGAFPINSDIDIAEDMISRWFVRATQLHYHGFTRMTTANVENFKAAHVLDLTIQLNRAKRSED